MNSRTVVAIVLCAAVWFLFMWAIPRVAVRPAPPAPPGAPPAGPAGPSGGTAGTSAAPGAKPEAPGATGTAGPSSAATPGPAAPPAADHPATPEQPEETIVLETATLRAELTNRGASIRKLVLRKFHAEDGAGELVLLDEFEEGRRSLTVHDKGASLLPDLRQVVWEIDRKATERGRRAVFRYARADGLVFRKEIATGGGDYLLHGELGIENPTSAVVNVRPVFAAAAGVSSEGGLRYATGVAAVRSATRWTLLSKTVSDVGKGTDETPAPEAPALVPWVGTSGKYFAGVLLQGGWADRVLAIAYEPVLDSRKLASEREQTERVRGRPLTDGEAADLRNKHVINLAGQYLLREMPVPGGERRTFAWEFYAGPKQGQALEVKPDAGLDLLLDYGFASSVSKVLLAVLLFFGHVTRNYGVAVILLTCLVRLCLFPISRKSQISGFRMQQLQPQLTALKEKFKNDKQRFAAEQMRLFKENRVNPFSSCLPLLLQIPVFIGLFKTLDMSIELRQAPFVFWIRDLSQPDCLWQFPSPLPLLGWTHLNLLPILMLVPMIIQTALMPKPVDPMQAQQQKMMMYMMPGMFLLMCYAMPSGVSLYWFFSSLWGVGETRLIKKLWLKPAAAPAAGGK